MTDGPAVAPVTTTDEIGTGGGKDGEAPAMRLGELLAPVRRALVVACILQTIGAVAGVVPFVAVAEIVRELLGSGPVDDDRLWLLGRWTIAAFGVSGVLLLVAATMTHYADNDLQLSLRRRLAAHLRRVPLGWFTDHSAGAVKKAVGDDVASMHHVVAHALLDLCAAAVAPVVSIVYMFAVDWRLALVGLVPVLLGFGLYWGQMAVSTRYMADYNESLAAVNSAAVEFVHGIAVVKTFGQARRSHQRFLAVAMRFVDFFWDMVRGMLRLSAANEVLMAPLTALALLLGAGTLFVDQGWSTPAAVAAVAVVGVNLCGPILALGHSAYALQQASHVAGRVGALLRTPELPDAGTGTGGGTGSGTEGEPPGGTRVEFDGVSFSYDGITEVLHGVSLTLEPGTITALVGRSGSGKSTIAKLVPRFWDVTGGSVRLDGRDVRDIPLDDLYRRVGFVFQDVRLLSMSLQDNIRLAVPDAPDEQVHAAARAAQVHERILELPGGYDTVPGRDVLLSGGEAQRVSIARAVMADAPVLVLDEATAFADPDAEAAIQDALSTLIAGRTVLVIAHRLSTVVNVDRIAVVDGGRIVEQGRHDELLAAGGVYAALWSAHQRIGVEEGAAR